MALRKDRTLDELAQVGNVAQFVSFAPSHCDAPEQTFSRVWQHEPNHHFSTHVAAITTLLSSSPERSVNIRSFTPDSPRSRDFLYGLKDVAAVTSHLERLIGQGLFVIVNETVDVSDSGVSGVIEAGVMEFAPDDTPRCVEKPGTASFGVKDGIRILNTVYGFDPELPDLIGRRIEFSVHPVPRGYNRTHTLLWESEYVETCDQRPAISWPNRFSRVIGDKVYGLMVADLIGIRVPQSLVIARRLRPFSFGQNTGSHQCWLRTCPTEQVPGRFTTTSRWVDPFALLASEDPSNESIASVISQAAIPAMYSGAAITKRDGRLHVEGARGAGDTFMLGKTSPQSLPDEILCDIYNVNDLLKAVLGPVRFEWVHDGQDAWVVQLHRGKTSSSTLVIVPGEASEWATFRSDAGLEALREFLQALPDHVGLRLEGDVGLTSHMADLARKSGRPTRIARQKARSPWQLRLQLDH